jgi:V/A-type H+-transporting ATPase subunit E
MKPTDENVKVLSNAVLRDARSDADQVLADAKAKAEEIKHRAQEQAESERAKILEQANVDAERIRRQAIATTQLKARTMELEQREKLLKEVFETAKQRLTSVQRGSDYEKTAQRLLREALVQLGASQAKVRADEVTQNTFSVDMLEKMSKELDMQIQLDEPLEKGICVVVETEDGHRQYDNTFETRLGRMQDNLRTPVYRILMGEAL